MRPCRSCEPIDPLEPFLFFLVSLMGALPLMGRYHFKHKFQLACPATLGGTAQHQSALTDLKEKREG